ncbi:class I SAM-dependent methyltransferase [Nocardia sp. NPDC051833]|uniref:class I SAM-dependent methyltransferase n=1 Tax=Nocardia sp. NPDC051833 TaxID=3155674 RepID=UPI00343DFEFC
MPDDARFEWFADTMGVRADDRVLELGPGPGASLVRIAKRLRGGRIVGLDRSATAIGRAADRCAAEIADGRVRLVEGAIGPDSTRAVRAQLDGNERFDLVFAVNVNLFWTGPATAAWSMIRECLSPTGRLWFCYGYGSPTSPSTSPKPTPDQLTTRLTAAGFHCDITTSGDLLAAHAVPKGS